MIYSSVKDVIKKWYLKLEFPKEYDEEFFSALSKVKLPEEITVETYPVTCEDGKLNLLSVLYMCERAADNMSKINIPDAVIVDTLKDIVTWTKTWTNLKGELYLGQLSWLFYHLRGEIFKLGRLQFKAAKFVNDVEELNVKKGQNVIEIHIPEGGKLTVDECKKSIESAKEFYGKHFPQFEYEYFSCHSWLLDQTLKKYLDENSNILSFGDMFKRVAKEPSTAVMRYVVRWDATLSNLNEIDPKTSFAKKIKQAILSGEEFYEVLGVIKK